MNAVEIKRIYARDREKFEILGLPRPDVRVFDLDILEAIYGPPPVIMSFEDFRAYQVWMSDKTIELPYLLLGAEMGLGKTAAVLRAIAKLLRAKKIRKVLIVAPLKVAEITWPEEIAKWDFARHLTFTVITGDEDDRIIALSREADLHIINRENVVWLKDYLGVRRWKYDMLVYDEASRLKSGKKRTAGNVRKDGTQSRSRVSEFGTLRQMRYAFKKVVELSGTPAPNGLIDLWGPIYLLDQGKRLGKSKTAFENRWFLRNFKNFYQLTPHDWSHDEIMGEIKDIFFSLKTEDYLKLPPVIPVDHWIDLPPKVMEIYRRMEREMVLQEFDVEAVNNGVLTNKLLQIANGSIYKEDKSVVKLHDEKLDVLDSIMAEAAGRPVLLAYEFKFDLAAIKKRFSYARIFGDSKSDKRDWDAGKIKLLVTHPQSAGHGLNFQFGGNIQVWYGLTWSLELYLQFIKRLHRSGQLADRVFLHRILARKTADEAIVKMLKFRGVTQDAITAAVRAQVMDTQRE